MPFPPPPLLNYRCFPPLPFRLGSMPLSKFLFFSSFPTLLIQFFFLSGSPFLLSDLLSLPISLSVFLFIQFSIFGLPFLVSSLPSLLVKFFLSLVCLFCFFLFPLLIQFSSFCSASSLLVFIQMSTEDHRSHTITPVLSEILPFPSLSSLSFSFPLPLVPYLLNFLFF